MTIFLHKESLKETSGAQTVRFPQKKSFAHIHCVLEASTDEETFEILSHFAGKKPRRHIIHR
jgi:hypothetical protein